jgi:glycosyltransferase involved in cell wall biosynthesis
MSDGHQQQLERLKCLVIMPAYNESGSVARVVNELREHLPEFDVLVIDDGSVDHTAHLVPRDATCISLPFNLGIGGAMQTGYKYAMLHGYDLAVQVDADGQHPPSEVRALVEQFLDAKADLLIGSRFIGEGTYKQTLTRMAGIRVLCGLIQLLTGRKVTDCTSGFRVASRRVIRAYAHWYPDDYPEPEVILLLLRAGFSIKEVPIHMEERTTGETSIPFTRGLFYVLKVGIALILDTMRNPWPKGKVDAP